MCDIAFIPSGYTQLPVPVSDATCGVNNWFNSHTTWTIMAVLEKSWKNAIPI